MHNTHLMSGVKGAGKFTAGWWPCGGPASI